jgi:hypothetical protein
MKRKSFTSELKMKSIAFVKLDKNHEAAKELEAIKNREDVGLGAMLALVFVHKKFASVDRDSVNDLDSRIKEVRKKAEETVS